MKPRHSSGHLDLDAQLTCETMNNTVNTTPCGTAPVTLDSHQYTCKMDTADEVVQALANPKDLLVKKFPDVHERFLREHSNWDPQWIYRGHGDTTHRLVPSAFRTLEKDKKSDEDLMLSVLELPSNHILTMKERQSAELRLVCAFYKHSNRAGLSLPPLTHHLHKALLEGDEETLISPEDRGIEPWPGKELWPLFGIAQHYGIPTRLLDWSHSPFVAAYFAAKSAIDKHLDPTKHLAVWLCATAFIKGTEQDTRIQFIELASAGNPNMSLQQGVFTLLTPEKDMPSELDSYVDALTHKAMACSRSKNHGIQQGFPVFLKLELPVTQAPALLKILSTLGYSSNRVFHGFQGAASAAKEHFLVSSLKRNDSIELPKDVMDHFEHMAKKCGQTSRKLIVDCLRDSMVTHSQRPAAEFAGAVRAEPLDGRSTGPV
jgi:hypothetical protein